MLDTESSILGFKDLEFEKKGRFVAETKDAVAYSLETGKAIIDDKKETWNELVGQLLPKASAIFAVGGAGSWNGMDQKEADDLVQLKLIPRIEEQLRHPGLVVIMHDGDYDDLEKPDLGYVTGRLLDHFGNGVNRVMFIVAQKESWHPDELNGKNLRNAHGLQYITYLFPDNTYPDDHSSFTQDRDLVNSDKYEQWYIGASGQIAGAQLADYDNKVPETATRKAVFFRVKNNGELNQELQTKLEKAEQSGDTTLVRNLQGRIKQRERKYGLHWNSEGLPDINSKQYSNLQLEFVV